MRIFDMMKLVKNGGGQNGGHARKKQAGFTLVEVIVVIVIIAILAAIGVPALTGYIDKAKDKQYIADARDSRVAVRAAIDEIYAEEGSKVAGNAYFESGDHSSATKKYWYDDTLSLQLTTYVNGRELIDRAHTFLGDASPANFTAGYWGFCVVGPVENSNAFNADGFVWWFFPEGEVDGAPVIIVTYKVDRFNVADGSYWTNFTSNFEGNAVYNSNAGYEVYHCEVYF
jgi:prepilin-type N-terminal cleavage/methylation domain-containing protein